MWNWKRVHCFLALSNENFRIPRHYLIEIQISSYKVSGKQGQNFSEELQSSRRKDRAFRSPFPPLVGIMSVTEPHTPQTSGRSSTSRNMRCDPRRFRICEHRFSGMSGIASPSNESKPFSQYGTMISDTGAGGNILWDVRNSVTGSQPNCPNPWLGCRLRDLFSETMKSLHSVVFIEARYKVSCRETFGGKSPLLRMPGMTVLPESQSSRRISLKRKTLGPYAVVFGCLFPI